MKEKKKSASRIVTQKYFEVLMQFVFSFWWLALVWILGNAYIQL
jgi:hypothetical protein